MFNLNIRAIGKLTEPWLRQGVDMYVDRIKPLAKIQVIELAEGQKGSAKPDMERTRASEAQNLQKGLVSGSLIVALDQTGKQFDSPALAKLLQEHSDRPLTFLIGGSWGLEAEILKKSDLVLSLGKLTLPHSLARLVLAEQLYRALMINAGRAYHK